MKKITDFMAAALALSLAGCTAGGTASASVPAKELSFKPGTYTGSAQGRFGQISVEVELSDDAINSIKVTENNDSDGVSDLPVERIPKEIVEYQSLGVDSVSGATFTSNAVKSAVSKAVEKAGGDPKTLENRKVDYEDMPTEDITTGIAVIGSGMAGLVAASTAAEKGR
jgi:urocanate reductase